ncbi:hypothetical protein OJJOAM_001238 [Cupriavidus sp. H18C1]
MPATGAEWLAALNASSDDALVRDSGLALAAHFLVHARNGALPADPVARFHLGNGACVERLNWGRGPVEQGPRAVVRHDGQLPVRAGGA